MNFFKIKKNKIPFGKPLVDFKEINSVTKVLKSGIYAHGPISNLFEKKFCSFTGAKFSSTVSSCTAGMHLFYFALGIGRGDEVIVPAQTHTATAHAVELSGAKPVFVDCEIETGNIDPEKIQKKITKKTKAICVVHFLGIPVDMKKINYIAKKNNLFVLEDCALSLGASYNKTHTGILGDAGVFSFYPAKHITTGEGGIIITKNKSLYNKIKLLKSLGINKTFLERKTPGIYDAVEVGFNYRMSEIHASIGIKQIEKINNFIKKRKRNFEFLKKKFRTNDDLHIIDSTNKQSKNSFYCMNVMLSKKQSRNRMEIIKYLNKRNIGTSIYYPQPVPRMSYYKKKYGYKKNEFLNSAMISDQSISLPVGPHLSKNDLIYISKNFLSILKKFK